MPQPRARWLVALLLCGGPLVTARPHRAVGESDLVPSDDPSYRVLAELARDGLVPDAAPRQFHGLGEAGYTERQLLDFIASALEPLGQAGGAPWPWSTLSGRQAGWFRWLIDRYSDPLLARGIDLEPILATLERAAPQATLALGSLRGELRLGTGGDALDGRLEASGLLAFGERLTAGLTLATDGTWTYFPEHARDDLQAWFLEYDLSRHLTVWAGRRATRFGPGAHDLLWSDRARPIDSVGFRLRTQIFGRPFRWTQQTGTFAEGVRKYITVQRFEYEPADGLTAAGSFGLVTDRILQAAGTTVVPMYWARFLAGERSGGGRGNFLGSLDVAWRPGPQWTVYGQFFADDFDFSPEPPRTRQRLGWLGGAQFTPGGLPGSSWRLEAAILPDTGTYIGQQDQHLTWLRDGTVMGHEYGADAAGWLVSGRQRLGPWTDVTLSWESFRQLRESAAPARSTRVDLVARHDLGRHVQLGLGYRHRRVRNAGGLAGANRSSDTLFLEARASY